MRLIVTKEDIRKGVIGSAIFCPIGQALQRTMKDKLNWEFPVVTVGRDNARHYQNGICEVAKLSIKAQKFVENFDDNKKVQPFTTILTFKPRKRK